MPQTLLLIGTRKGCFVLESDADRRDWALRGPYCEAWPVYHAVLEPSSRAIYAAAASEWHGSAVWRSPDLGETWALSSEGLAYADDAGKISKTSTLAASRGRVLVGVEAPGSSRAGTRAATWSELSTLAGQPGSEVWDDPANQPPGHLGLSALMLDNEDDARFWAIVQGIGVFETGDGGASWTPRNRGLRAEWPREHEEVGFCVHKLVRSAADPTRMYQQNHCGMHRSDDLGWDVDRDHAKAFRATSASPRPRTRTTATRSTWSRSIPVTAAACRKATRPSGAPAMRARAGSGSTRGLPQHGAHVGVLREAMAIDSYDTPGLYFGTSTGQLFASADEGDSWSEIASYLPPISSVEVAVLD